MDIVNRNIRAFVSINVPRRIATTIALLQERLEARLPKQAVRWTPVGQLHLTLQFLGDVSTAHLAELKLALETLCKQSSSFVVRAQELGCFPNLARPRIVWLGLGGDPGRLEQLQAQVDAALQPWAEGSEERRFHPHLTLGRVRNVSPRAARLVGERVKETSPALLSEWRVGEVYLMQSKLSPGGAEHSVLASASLSGFGR